MRKQRHHFSVLTTVRDRLTGLPARIVGHQSAIYRLELYGQHSQIIQRTRAQLQRYVPRDDDPTVAGWLL